MYGIFTYIITLNRSVFMGNPAGNIFPVEVNHGHWLGPSSHLQFLGSFLKPTHTPTKKNIETENHLQVKTKKQWQLLPLHSPDSQGRWLNSGELSICFDINWCRKSSVANSKYIYRFIVICYCCYFWWTKNPVTTWYCKYNTFTIILSLRMVPWSAVSRCHKKYKSEGPLKKWFLRAIIFTRGMLAFGRFDPWWINTPLSLSGGSHENERMSMSFFGGIRGNQWGNHLPE